MPSSAGSVLPRVVVGALLVLYPFLVYSLIDRLPPFALVTILLAICAARLLLVGKLRRDDPFLSAILAGAAGVLLLASLDGELAIRTYPVLVSACLALLFGLSLLRPPPIIERFARLTRPEIDADTIAYARGVTWLWLAFFLANALVAGWTVLYGSLWQWTFYNGFLSYLFVGALFLAELAVRTYRQRPRNQ